MKFLVDAQLPGSLTLQLSAAGHDAVHTSELPGGNRTPDDQITALAIEQGRVVVTKDSDFIAEYLLHGKPPKLLLIATGNIKNAELLSLFRDNLSSMVEIFERHSFVELNSKTVIVHE